MATISGFTLSPQFISVQCMNTLGGGGTAKFLISEIFSGNKSSYIADLGKTITITETRSGHSIVVWKGELIEFKQINEHQYEMLAECGGRKVFTQPSKHNQILSSGNVEYLVGDTMEDVDKAPFDIAWDDGGNQKALVIKKGGLVNTTIHPASVSFEATEISNGGTMAEMAFDNGAYTGGLGNGNEYAINDITASGVGGDGLIFTYTMYAKDVTNLIEIDIKNICAISKESGAANMDLTTGDACTVRIYNYNLTAYKDVYDYTTADGWSKSETNSPVTTEKRVSNLVGAVGDYINSVGGVNSSGFQQYELKVIVNGPASTGGNVQYQTRVFYQHLQFTFDGNQSPAISQGYITTATTSKLTFDPSQGWALDDFPIADGFGKNDTWYALDWLDNMVPAIFTSSGTSFTLDWNVTGSDEHTDIDNIYDRMVGDLLNKYTNFLNSIWMYEPSDNKIYARSIDNVSTVTYSDGGPQNSKITEAHIIRGVNGYSDFMSIKNIKTHLRVVGSAFADITAITEEYTLTQGDETAVEVDPTITSSHLLATALTNRQYKYKKAKRDIRFAIDLSINSAHWLNLKLGYFIDLKVPNASGAHLNFVDGSTEALLIYGLGLRWDKNTGWNDEIDLILQRRHNA